MTDAINLAPCCANCRFSVIKATLPTGTCNRHAPKPVLGLEASDWTAWPQIHKSDWCGEWAPGVSDDELFANYLACNASTLPTFDGIPVLPLDEPAPPAPSFSTYDEPFEDPLR